MKARKEDFFSPWDKKLDYLHLLKKIKEIILLFRYVRICVRGLVRRLIGPPICTALVSELHAILNPPKRGYPSSNARWKSGWYCILGQYVFEKAQIEFLFLQKKNVLKFLYWGSDVLEFLLKWGLAMFLRCSYFFPNLSLHVLIDLVLKRMRVL